MADRATAAEGGARLVEAELVPLWRISDVSAFLGVPVGTLYQWRYTGVGPKAYRLGKHLRYRRADVESWLAEQVA